MEQRRQAYVETIDAERSRDGYCKRSSVPPVLTPSEFLPSGFAPPGCFPASCGFRDPAGFRGFRPRTRLRKLRHPARFRVPRAPASCGPRASVGPRASRGPPGGSHRQHWARIGQRDLSAPVSAPTSVASTMQYIPRVNAAHNVQPMSPIAPATTRPSQFQRAIIIPPIDDANFAVCQACRYRHAPAYARSHISLGLLVACRCLPRYSSTCLPLSIRYRARAVLIRDQPLDRIPHNLVPHNRCRSDTRHVKPVIHVQPHDQIPHDRCRSDLARAALALVVELRCSSSTAILSSAKSRRNSLDRSLVHLPELSGRDSHNM